ncbi:MAG: helix-turn-helix domain-containing protein [Ruminococcaceae bacterium]|nr:helix-turn-helix domain-containing protein [Oscillospiraceae bacterium]
MNKKASELQMGASIARLRKKQGLTQAQLAEMLCVSNKTVSKWERGAGYPEITQLYSLSRILGTTVDTLLMSERQGITVAGSLVADRIKLISTYPKMNMLSTIYSVSNAVGGSVPNVSIDLARIDRKLKVNAIGRVGNDADGRYLVDELRKNGIDVSGVLTSTTAGTSFTDVMTVHDTGERTFFHYRGANAEFYPEDVDIPTLSCKMLHAAYILMMDAFDAEDPEYGTVMARFLSNVQKAGILTSIDVVSDSSGLFAEKVIPALHYTDNAFMNEIEACGISGLPPRDENGKLLVENIRQTMEQIMAEGVGYRVIVHCPEAGFCLNRAGEFTVVPSLKLPKGYIKGTVGAGDAFCAGCLYGIYKGFDDKKILEFASGAACCNLSAVDSVSGMRDEEYIFDFIRRHERVEI